MFAVLSWGASSCQVHDVPASAGMWARRSQQVGCECEEISTRMLCLERWAGARHAWHRDVLGGVSGEKSMVSLQIGLFPWLWSPEATDSGALALWWLQPANSYPNLPDRYISILFRKNLNHNPERLFFPPLTLQKGGGLCTRAERSLFGGDDN